MSNKDHIWMDPGTAAKIRAVLSDPVEEPERPDLPKPVSLEVLRRWSLKPAPVHAKTVTPTETSNEDA